MRVFFSTPPVTRVAVALALCTTIASTLAHAGQTKPAAPITGAERELLHQMGLEKYGRVDYRDVKGALITFAQFQALQPAFPSFGIEKRTNGAAKSAVISRQAAETAPAAHGTSSSPAQRFRHLSLPQPTRRSWTMPPCMWQIHAAQLLFCRLRVLHYGGADAQCLCRQAQRRNRACRHV